MEEIKDIAMWEETDSELAKKNILELSSSIKYHIDFNKKLIDEINRLEMIIGIKNKRIDELNKRLDKKGKRIDKAIETIEQLKEGSYIKYTETTALAYHIPQPCCVARLDVIEDILRGEDNE